MKILAVEVPAMYGDHHVVEVRNLLLALPGVAEVYASSSFRSVEVEYDETQVEPASVTAKLEEAGYLDELPIPVEVEAQGPRQNGDVFFRQTVSVTAVSGVHFAQQVPYAGPPLWPCPGLGRIRINDEEVGNG